MAETPIQVTRSAITIAAHQAAVDTPLLQRRSGDRLSRHQGVHLPPAARAHRAARIQPRQAGVRAGDTVGVLDWDTPIPEATLPFR